MTNARLRVRANRRSLSCSTYWLNAPALADAITGATRASDGEPVGGFTGADWPEVADEISNAQWQAFAFDLFRLNNGVTAGPTSRTASLVMRSSETNSEQPEA